MPIYEYRCKTCGKKSEVLFFNYKKTKNPICCKKLMTKTIGKTSFILKGGGWYSDGYSKKGEK